MKRSELEAVAWALVAKGKGLLAADESFPTIEKRFNALNIKSTEEDRRAYRGMLFATEGIETGISGVILFDETLRQKADDGTPFVDLLKRKGIIPGIKVDRGTMNMPGFPGEKITAGLDGLRERLAEYRGLGARFTKWRAVIAIGGAIPTQANLRANAHGLAVFAALSQEAGLVPVVEPEVLMDGGHDIGRCEEVSLAALGEVFARLREYRVALEAMLLKPAMILSGKEAIKQAGPAEIAERTISTLLRVVPAAVPGIAFLSGGQGPEQATINLNTMNTLGPHPWELSFSYGRALQEPALRAWNGSAANIDAAQRLFRHRVLCNSRARFGEYSEELEQAA